MSDGKFAVRGQRLCEQMQQRNTIRPAGDCRENTVIERGRCYADLVANVAPVPSESFSLS